MVKKLRCKTAWKMNIYFVTDAKFLKMIHIDTSDTSRYCRHWLRQCAGIDENKADILVPLFASLAPDPPPRLARHLFVLPALWINPPTCIHPPPLLPAPPVS